LPGRSAQEALKKFIDPLKETVSCLGQQAKWVYGSKIALGQRVTTSLASPVTVKSSLYDRGLTLTSTIAVKIIEDGRPNMGPYRCSTQEYIHTISTGNERLLAFHWHPENLSPELGPHLHLGKKRFPQLKTIHIPTSRTTLEYVIRMMLDELGADPTPTKPSLTDDRRQKLDQVEARHTEHRSWSSYDEGRRRSSKWPDED